MLIMEEDIYLFCKTIYILRVAKSKYSQLYTVGAFKTNSAAKIYFKENYDVNKCECQIMPIKYWEL